ncbi:MAG: hypothetical protein FWF94_02910 [Oscillospiraceae bacterium]|nr:hypothetical protein [Oscillospiraceae bacterium]
MSGGFWNYEDRSLIYLADELRREIAKSRIKQGYANYSDAFIKEMSCVYNSTRGLVARLRRMDWVLSGDDGESDYKPRLAKDMAEIEYDDPAKDIKWLESLEN